MKNIYITQGRSEGYGFTYLDYGSTGNIPEDACSLRLYRDLTALN